jgi:hypothetical protein
LWEIFKLVSNLEVIEKNERYQFDFSLHVDTKKNKWKDMSIPFPETAKSNKDKDLGGIRQLPKHIPVSRKPYISERRKKLRELGLING